MIGPVQLLMIGFKDPELPSDVRRTVDDLRANPAVKLLDVQVYHKERGVASRQELSGFTTEGQSGAGGLVDQMMTRTMASEVMSGGAPSGRGYLMRGDPIPDPTNDVPDNTNVLVLMLEHLWATPLFDSVRDSSAFPLTDAWLGRQSLAQAGLDVG
jgi:hypothetical protein